MNIADMKATMRATLNACATDNERLLVMSAAIRAQAKHVGKARREEAGRCNELMDVLERYCRGEATADDCRRVVDAQPSDQFELVDIAQGLTWNVDKFVRDDGFTAPGHAKRMAYLIPSILHGCGVGDTQTARQAVSRAVLDMLVTMLNARPAAESRGAA